MGRCSYLSNFLDSAMPLHWLAAVFESLPSHWSYDDSTFGGNFHYSISTRDDSSHVTRSIACQNGRYNKLRKGISHIQSLYRALYSRAAHTSKQIGSAQPHKNSGVAQLLNGNSAVMIHIGPLAREANVPVQSIC